MQFNELQKQTNTNIQEKANLIWESAKIGRASCRERV